MTTPRMLRVLLIDNDPPMLKACARLLAKQHCSVTAVESGADALAAMRAGAFDVVLTDFRMPVMSGLELLDHVRQRDPGVRRVLMSTGVVPALHEYQALGLVHAFLPKPLDAARTWEALRPED